MPSNTACQLLIDPPAAGTWNMAVDEALLDEAADSGQMTLRFYQWQRPTLSLGYFQKAADRSQHPASTDADVVRRLSGGGAIIHDQELTYSFILPKSHPLARETQAIYDAVHRAIVKTLNEFLSGAHSHWQATLCEPTSQLAAQDEPFLCFQRRSAGDILLRNNGTDLATTDHKIVGSAQRRRKGVVLQHGSLLLHKSQVASELPGISDITQLSLSTTDLLDKLPACLASSLPLGGLRPSSLADPIAVKALELQEKKYQSPSWTERR